MGRARVRKCCWLTGDKAGGYRRSKSGSSSGRARFKLNWSESTTDCLLHLLRLHAVGWKRCCWCEPKRVCSVVGGSRGQIPAMYSILHHSILLRSEYLKNPPSSYHHRILYSLLSCNLGGRILSTTKHWLSTEIVHVVYTILLCGKGVILQVDMLRGK